MDLQEGVTRIKELKYEISRLKDEIDEKVLLIKEYYRVIDNDLIKLDKIKNEEY